MTKPDKEIEKSQTLTNYDNSTTISNDIPLDIATDRRQSAWWPFKKSLLIPEYLDGSLAGDLGFDPLGIAVNKENLFTLREAEYRHARLAMLAAIGWPISELVHYRLSESMGVPNLLAENFRAPSVLNGGLNNIYALSTLGLFFTVGSILEIELEKRKDRERNTPADIENFLNMWREDGWDIPGNYGFDPLKLGKYMSNDDKDLKFIIQTVEIFNGRIAMLAVVGYVVQEYITGLPVISETPEFFRPFYEINFN
eukprot:gene19700-25622_t